MTTPAQIDETIKRVLEAPRSDFVSLLKIAGLDPKTDLRFGNWSGLDLTRADLRGFDFTGADLTGVKFEGARIAGARFENAIYDPDSLALAADFPQSPPPQPSTPWTRSIANSPIAILAGAATVMAHLRLCRLTNRQLLVPPDIRSTLSNSAPVILAIWHSQRFVAIPFIGPLIKPCFALAPVTRDGEILSRLYEMFGLQTIRGSGSRRSDYMRRKAVTAFRELTRALQGGASVALSADVPKIARLAGMGIPTLARVTGRPIVPIAVVSSRRHALSNWDQTTLCLPFGKTVLVAGSCINVPPDASDRMLEDVRLGLEGALDDLTNRATALADS